MFAIWRCDCLERKFNKSSGALAVFKMLAIVVSVLVTKANRAIKRALFMYRDATIRTGKNKGTILFIIVPWLLKATGGENA